jgi:O-antigen/teichoic acid export membrane protein
VPSLPSKILLLGRRLWRRLFRPGYGRNVLVVFSGTVVAKVVTVAAAPVLARLFTPGDYGLLGLFTSFLSLLVLAGSLGYARAVVLPRSDRDAAGLVWLSVGILSAITVVSASAIWLFGAGLASSVNAPALAPLLWWLPIAVFATGTFQVMEMWTSRRKRFGQLSMANITRSSGTVGTQLGTGFAGFAGGGLIGGLTVGQIAAVAVLGTQQWRLDAATLKQGLRWRRLPRLARRHRDFPLLSLPAQLLSSGRQAAIPVLLSLFFTPAVAGLFWFGHRLIALATETFAHAVRRVFYQRAAELFSSGQSVHRLLVRNTVMMLGLGILPTLIVFISGPALFEFVFGGEWREAGEYVRWLVILGMASCVAVPAMELMYVFELQKWLLWLTACQLVATVASIVVGGLAGSPRLAIILLSLSVTFLYLTCSAGVIWYAKHHSFAQPGAR